MIYDCFLFYNELHILDMRLNILDSVVDKFVLVEATQTFMGNEKELIYQNNKHLFEKFNHKIIHVIVDDTPETDNPWVRADYQRNAVFRALVDCDDSDIIIIADVDEIPKPEKIIEYKDKPGIKAFRQYMFRYYLNNITKNDWCHAKMLSYKLFKNALNHLNNYSYYTPKEVNQGTTASKVRVLHFRCSYFIKLLHPKAYIYFIADGGWHFTSVMSNDSILNKLRNFAGCKGNPRQKNVDDIEQTVQKSGKQAIFVSKDNLPEYIVDNQELFKDYLLLDGQYNIKDIYPIKSDRTVNFRRKLSWWIPTKKWRNKFRRSF